MGEKIKKIMEQKNVAQVELAKAAGVSEAFISYVLDDKKMPSVPVLKRIAKRLGVLMDELVTESV